MKLKHIIIALIALLPSSILAQQKEAILHIKKVYYELKEDIAFSREHKFEGRLYCNKLEENVNGKSWSGVGTYHSVIEYWYDDNPVLVDDYSENPQSCLKMVIENTVSADRKYYIEYLFDEGQLIFVYYKSPTNEMRFYANNNMPIKILGEFEEGEHTWDEVTANANRHMQTFLSSFGLKERTNTMQGGSYESESK